MAKAKKDDQDIVDKIQARFGAGALMAMSAKAEEGQDVIPTGSPRLDRALGIGGWPRGRIVEIFGGESSGKSSTCLNAIAQAQRLGLRVAYVDAEHALDPSWAETCGVDLPNMMLSQPDYGEQGLDITQALVDSGEFGLIVVDSVAALTPKAELEGEMGDQHVGRQARMMGAAMRKLCAGASKSNTCLIFVNQTRLKVGIVYGSPITTPGGNAVKFFSSIRVSLSGSKVKEGDTIVATLVKAKVVKNKMAPPFREAEMTIAFEHGLDSAADVLEDAVSLGVMSKGGAWITYDADRGHKWCGRPAALDALRYDPPLFDEVVAKVRTAQSQADQEVAQARADKVAKAKTKAAPAQSTEDAVAALMGGTEETEE